MHTIKLLPQNNSGTPRVLTMIKGSYNLKIESV